MKKIARDLHLSRNTVRKILRSGETDFTYERERQPMPRIGPWQGQLEQFLSANAGKASRERLTLIRFFEELRGLGYEGAHDAVRLFAKVWSQNRGPRRSRPMCRSILRRAGPINSIGATRSF